MKTRNGFVSNSSTSSFLVCGWEFNINKHDEDEYDYKDIKKICDKFNLDKNVFEDKNKEYIHEILTINIAKRLKIKNKNVVVKSINDCVLDMIIGVGFNRDAIKIINDEDIKQLISYKTKLKKTFPKMGEPKIKFGTCSVN